MEFTSILLSAKHIFSPIHIKEGNKDLSIEDKKTTALALSLFVGLFTAGLGGIILFYCLTAKYKIEKLHDNHNPTSEKERSIKSETESIKKVKIEPVKMDQESIDDFVASFLHPYITGQITQESDPKDRKPMMELLIENMEGFDPEMKGIVEEMALNAFFEKAAMGLYVNQRRHANARDLTSESSEFDILVKALREALPREFPNIKFSTQNIKERASKALNVVNEKRKLARIEALTYSVEGDPNLRFAKLKQLQETGQLFLV